MKKSEKTIYEVPASEEVKVNMETIICGSPLPGSGGSGSGNDNNPED